MSRYPAWSQPLDLEGDALALAEEEQPEAVAHSGNGQVRLQVLAERSSFDAPEPVVLRVRLTGADESASGKVAGIVKNGHGHSASLLVFEREWTSAARPTGWYVATFTPKEMEEPNGVFTVHVIGTLHDERLSVDVPIVYNQSYGQLTGRFRDTLDNGDLSIDAEVNVARGAEFSVRASLYGRLQQQALVSGSSDKRMLTPGTHWLRIKFSGLALRDKNVEGPYVLSYVALTTSTANAEARARALKNAHVTAHYSAAAFTGDPENDSEKLAEAEELLARAARVARERLAANQISAD